jgi:hypothetical protein
MRAPRKVLAARYEPMGETTMTEPTKFFFLDDEDPSDEGLDDVHVGTRALSAAVVYNTDWTVETITRQVDKGAIDLTPSFQRRDAWSLPKKSLLIESILLNFPVPPLTLAEVGATKNFVVVDGKQRLTTLSQFFGLMPAAKFNGFRLTGLRELPELNGLDIAALEAQHPAQFRALENYSVRTNVIRGWHRDEVLYSIFLRLNSGSVKLSPQELRQALHPGPFTEWLSDYSTGSPALRAIFSGPEPDFRMRDIELMIRYLALQFFLPQYRGDLKRFLDGAAKTLNEEWDQRRVQLEEIAGIFEDAYTAVLEIFGTEHSFRKWVGGKWESRLNRAVFDLMMFYLTDRDRIERFRKSGELLVSDFQSLCEKNADVRDSIETTTKSIEAVATRLGAWGLALAHRGVVDEVVVLTNDRELTLNAPAQ